MKDQGPRPRLVLIYADDLAATQDEPGGPEPESLLDQLDTPVGDGLLIALRRILAATYCGDTGLDELEKTTSEIRREAINGLRGMGRMLATLRLKSLGPGELPEDHGPKVFKFCLAKTAALPRRVKVEGEAGIREFLELVRWADAKPLLATLRKIVSVAFGELITRKAYVQAIWQIRKMAADSLVPLNDWLEEIGLEPVAMPTRQYVDDEWEDDPEHPRFQDRSLG